MFNQHTDFKLGHPPLSFSLFSLSLYSLSLLFLLIFFSNGEGAWTAMRIYSKFCTNVPYKVLTKCYYLWSGCEIQYGLLLSDTFSTTSQEQKTKMATLDKSLGHILFKLSLWDLQISLELEAWNLIW